MLKTLGLLLGCVALVSCGSGSGGGGSGTCQQIGTAICSKACSCRDGAACAISQGGLTLDFTDEADCRTLYVTVACSASAKPYNDAAACLPMIQAATCASTGAEGALAFPTDSACDSP